MFLFYSGKNAIFLAKYEHSVRSRYENPGKALVCISKITILCDNTTVLCIEGTVC